MWTDIIISLERWDKDCAPSSLSIIGNSAFIGCDILVKINIPESVTHIGPYAFYACRSLTNIVIPNGVLFIGADAFHGCESLIDLVIPEKIISIESNTFSGCGFTSISIHKNIQYISSNAFSFCNNLTNITVDNENPIYYSVGNCVIIKNNKELIFGCKTYIIPNDGSVERISSQAFYGCCFKEIVIPKSVKYIGDYAFGYCSKLSTIYYTGTEEEWNTIEIGNDYGSLFGATRYYYSETEPELNEDGTAYNGSYWHYDADGVTPVIWKKEN